MNIKIKKAYAAFMLAAISSVSYAGNTINILPDNSPMAPGAQKKYLDFAQDIYEEQKNNSDQLYKLATSNEATPGGIEAMVVIRDDLLLGNEAKKSNMTDFEKYMDQTNDRYKELTDRDGKNRWQKAGCESLSPSDVAYHMNGCMDLIKEDFKSWKRAEELKKSNSMLMSLGITNKEAKEYAKKAGSAIYDSVVVDILGDWLNQITKKNVESVVRNSYYSPNITQFTNRYVAFIPADGKKYYEGDTKPSIYNDDKKCSESIKDLEGYQGALDAIDIEMNKLKTDILSATSDESGNPLSHALLEIKLADDPDLQEYFDQYRLYKEYMSVINDEIESKESTLASEGYCAINLNDWKSELHEVKIMSNGLIIDYPLYSPFDNDSLQEYYYLAKVRNPLLCYPTASNNNAEYDENSCSIKKLHILDPNANGYRNINGVEYGAGRPISFTMMPNYTDSGLPDYSEYQMLLAMGDDVSIIKKETKEYNFKGLFKTIKSLAMQQLPSDAVLSTSTSSQKTLSSGGDVHIIDVELYKDKITPRTALVQNIQNNLIDGDKIKDRVWLTTNLESGYIRLGPDSNSSGQRYVLATQSKMTNPNDAASTSTKLNFKFGLLPMPETTDLIASTKATEKKSQSRVGVLDESGATEFKNIRIANDKITYEVNLNGVKYFGTEKGDIYSTATEKNGLNKDLMSVTVKKVLAGNSSSSFIKGKNIPSSCPVGNIGCGQPILGIYSINSRTVMFMTTDFVGYIDLFGSPSDTPHAIGYSYITKPEFKNSSNKIKSIFKYQNTNFLILSDGTLAQVALGGENQYGIPEIKIREIAGKYNQSLLNAKQIVSDGSALYWVDKNNIIYAQSSQYNDIDLNGPKTPDSFLKIDPKLAINQIFKNSVGEFRDGSIKDSNISISIDNDKLRIYVDDYIIKHLKKFDSSSSDMVKDASFSGLIFSLPIFSKYPNNMIWEGPVEIISTFKTCNLPKIDSIYTDIGNNQLSTDFICNYMLPQSQNV